MILERLGELFTESLFFGEVDGEDTVGLDGEAGDGVLMVAYELEGFVLGLELVVTL